jgi:hypothetical protein
MDFTLDPSGGGVMKRFHGRWTIRPHPKDPEHSSLSTLDQVCAGVVEQQGITAPTAAGGEVGLGWDVLGRKFCCQTKGPHLPALPNTAHAPGVQPDAGCLPLIKVQDVALNVSLPPPLDRILKRISCRQVRNIFEDVKK